MASLRRPRTSPRPAQSSRPKRPKRPNRAQVVAGPRNVGGVPGGVSRNAPPPAPGTPVGTPPVQSAPPAPYRPPANLPPSLQGATGRTGTREGYALTVNEANEALRQALLNYGATDIDVPQYNAGDDNAVTQWRSAARSPNSALGQIMQSYQDNLRGAGDSMTRNNTFFGGIHAQERSRIGDERARAEAQAFAEFQAAVSEYMKSVLGARVDRDKGMSEADLADLEPLVGSEVTPGATGTIPLYEPPLPPKGPTSVWGGLGKMWPHSGRKKRKGK